MSQTLSDIGIFNKKRLERVYTLLQDGRSDYLSVLCRPDCTFTLLGDRASVPLAGTWQGIEAIQAFHDRYFSQVRVIEILIEDMLVSSHKAFVHLHVKAEHRASKYVMETERCDIIDIDEGRAWRIKCFVNSHPPPATTEPSLNS